MHSRDRFLFPIFSCPGCLVAPKPTRTKQPSELLAARGVAVGGRRYGDRVSPPLADHDQIGTSTGVFASSRGSWPSLVDQATRVSTIAVELSALSALSALSGDELPGLVSYLRSEPR